MAVAHVKKCSALWAISFWALHDCIGRYKWYDLELAVKFSTQCFSLRKKTPHNKPTVHWSWNYLLLKGTGFDGTFEGKFLSSRLEFWEEIKPHPRRENVLLVGRTTGGGNRGEKRVLDTLTCQVHNLHSHANTAQLVILIFILLSLPVVILNGRWQGVFISWDS